MNAPPATKSAAKGPREGRGLRAAVAVARALALFKILVWWVFLPAFGFLCVRHWLLIPALLLSLGGTAIGLQIVRHAEPGTFMGSLPMRLLGGVALLINVVVGLSALLLFAAPLRRRLDPGAGLERVVRSGPLRPPGRRRGRRHRRP
jgi:hypothetical protein